MNDEKLFQLCKKYGAQALEARRKFAGLLPEVNRRKLYKKKGFGSIYHFAAVLAGMSHEQVASILRLEKKLEDKPVLKKMLTSGEESHHKLERVSSIATGENQKELAEKVKALPRRALDTYVKDIKALSGQNNPQETMPDVNLLEHLSIDLQKELIKRLNKGIDINQLLLGLLQKHDSEILEEKERLSQEAKPTKSTYIKVAVQKVLQKEHGTKCSIPGCNKDAKVNHHTCRFSISKTHDPKYLAPLCKEHHQIAHTVDIKYQLAIAPPF